MALINKLTAIGNAIRSKTGGTDKLTLDQMPNAIRSISGSGSSENRLAALCDNTLTAVTAEDFGAATRIKENTFFDNTNLTSVEIPNTITSIGKAAFSGTGITRLEVPESVRTVSSWAFSHCDSLLTATLNHGVSTLDSYCFFDCSILNDIHIPVSVDYIGEKALAATDLQNIYYGGTREDWLAIDIDSTNNESLYGYNGTLDAPGMGAPTIHFNS